MKNIKKMFLTISLLLIASKIDPGQISFENKTKKFKTTDFSVQIFPENINACKYDPTHSKDCSYTPYETTDVALTKNGIRKIPDKGTWALKIVKGKGRGKIIKEGNFSFTHFDLWVPSAKQLTGISRTKISMGKKYTITCKNRECTQLKLS